MAKRREEKRDEEDIGQITGAGERYHGHIQVDFTSDLSMGELPDGCGPNHTYLIFVSHEVTA